MVFWDDDDMMDEMMHTVKKLWKVLWPGDNWSTTVPHRHTAGVERGARAGGGGGGDMAATQVLNLNLVCDNDLMGHLVCWLDIGLTCLRLHGVVKQVDSSEVHIKVVLSLTVHLEEVVVVNARSHKLSKMSRNVGYEIS